MKKCTMCKEEKNNNEFYKDKRGRDGLQSRCKKCTKSAAVGWRKANGNRYKEIAVKSYYKDLDRPRKYRRKSREKRPRWTAYIRQKSQAKCRGIDWHFTFDSWCKWWGDDFYLRGRGPEDLCMARKNDEGHYSPENCVKATMQENWQKLV